MKTLKSLLATSALLFILSSATFAGHVDAPPVAPTPIPPPAKVEATVSADTQTPDEAQAVSLMEATINILMTLLSVL